MPSPFSPLSSSKLTLSPLSPLLLLLVFHLLLSSASLPLDHSALPPFCKEYYVKKQSAHFFVPFFRFDHLSLCQLRRQLIRLDQLLDSAIGEIDFLAGVTGSPESGGNIVCVS